MPIKMKNGDLVKLPKFPLEYKGERVEKKNDPPEIGDANVQILKEIGITDKQIELMKKNNLVK